MVNSSISWKPRWTIYLNSHQTNSNVNLGNILVMLGSFIPDDENKRINQIVMSVLSFFTATVIFSGIRVMIFPISIICLLCSFYLALFHLEDDNDDFPIKVLRLMDRSKRSDYSTRLGFRVQLCCPHLASLAILCLLANPRLFEGCVILGAINITFSALLISNDLYELDMIYLSARDALRADSISVETIEELEYIYPLGFDTERFQYLLHDTLREEGRGRRSTHTNVSQIQMLINIFPSGIINKEDDEGATPFLVACQCSSVEVVEYLIGIDRDLLHTTNGMGDTGMHYACRGRNYKVVEYLLNRHMQLVTKRNTQGYLPVYLLCGTGEDSSNFDDPEHVETIWRLLLAYPEDMS